MAETPADVKRDIEMTRERISDTLQKLEQKTDVMQVVKDHPWPAVAVAFGAGLLLSGSGADVKAASATAVASRTTGTKVGTVLDDVLANLMGGLSLAFQQRVDSLVDELKLAIGGQAGGGTSRQPSFGAQGSQRFADADVTPPATRGDGVAAAGTTGMGSLGHASQDARPDAGAQGTSPSNREGFGRAD